MMMSKDEQLVLPDGVGDGESDGDYVRFTEVGGFGQPMIMLLVSQEGEESSANINAEQAKEIRAWLKKFLDGC